MRGLIHIGFGNYVSADKVIALVNYDGAPVKRYVQVAKEKGLVIDATQGRKTRAAIFSDGGQVVLSALQPETIAGRVEAINEETGD